MQELKNLREILARGEFQETGQDVDELEKRLRLEVIKERFTRNTLVADYLAYLLREIARCKQQLSENEDLTDRERIKLFARKQACQDFLNHFQSHKAEVENDIKDMLAVFRLHPPLRPSSMK